MKEYIDELSYMAKRVSEIRADTDDTVFVNQGFTCDRGYFPEVQVSAEAFKELFPTGDGVDVKQNGGYIQYQHEYDGVTVIALYCVRGAGLYGEVPFTKPDGKENGNETV